MSELELVLPAARRRVRDLLARWSEAVAPDDAPTLTERAARESVRGVESVIRGDCGLYVDGRRAGAGVAVRAGAAAATPRVRLDRAAEPRGQDVTRWRRSSGCRRWPSRTRSRRISGQSSRLRRAAVRGAQAGPLRRPRRGRRRRRGGGLPRPKFVVTVRHGETDVLRRVREELDGGDSQLLGHGPTAVLYRAADLVVDGYEEAIEFINEDVDEIETQVFGSRRRGPLERIYKLKREIAEFRRAVLPLAGPLDGLAAGTIARHRPARGAVLPRRSRPRAAHRRRDRGHDRLLSDVLQADLARVAAQLSGRTRSPSGRTRTCARSRRGPRSRWCRPPSPASTG